MKCEQVGMMLDELGMPKECIITGERRWSDEHPWSNGLCNDVHTISRHHVCAAQMYGMYWRCVRFARYPVFHVIPYRLGVTAQACNSHNYA